VVPLPWVWPVPLPAEALAFGAAGRYGAAACGVAAPNAKLRALVVPQGPPEQDEPASEDAAAAECEVDSLQARPNRISWARLLKRVLATT
jgi:hypothetical protein